MERGVLKLVIYVFLLGAAITLIALKVSAAELHDDEIIVTKSTHTLRVYTHDNKNHYIQDFDVITGRPNAPTPDFETQFQTIDINPEWNPTPKSIRELRKNHELVEEYGVIFEPNGRVWAPSGDKNPMGKARLNLQYMKKIVRIHGTNEPELFKTTRRNYSSGCIRVLYIKELVELIVKTQTGQSIDWSRHYQIKLPHPIHVVVN
jgi:murein L,D-transpeptidase YcbB/YkuD